MLYVGTTYTPHGDYRHDVPAISSRNLLDLKFAEYSFSKQVHMSLKIRHHRNEYEFIKNYVLNTHVYK